LPSSFRVGFLGNSHTQTDSHELQIHILGRVHGHFRLKVDGAGLDLGVIIQEFGGLVSPKRQQLVIFLSVPWNVTMIPLKASGWMVALDERPRRPF
jgi:hypothetical protein